MRELEKQYAALAADLQYAPPNKIRVEVLDDAQALSRVSTLSLEAIKTSGTIAICKFNRLMITSPKALWRGYGWIDTLAHEYTHLVVSKKSNNETPIWIHEGLAKFLESRWRGAPGQALSPASAGLLADALKQNKLIPFERMHPSMALLPSQADAQLAFAEVFTAVEYMYAKGGAPLLAKLVDTLKGGEAHDAAVAKVMNTTFAKFQADWRTYLAKREYPKETIPLSADLLRFKDEPVAGKKKEDPNKPKDDKLHFEDFEEIADTEARKSAHLGQLFRTRKRHGAAVEEFARAYAKVGSKSFGLSNHYAESLIQTQDLAKAEQVLLASLKPFPTLPRTYGNLARVYLATKRPAEAEKCFLEVIAVDPFDPEPHLGLVKIYGEQKDKRRTDREVESLKLLSGKEGAPMSAKGLIEVRSHPFAKVLLDGNDTGKTTPASLEVTPGRHAVKLVNEERGLAKEEVLEIGAGEEKAVEVAFEQDAPKSSAPPTAAPAAKPQKAAPPAEDRPGTEDWGDDQR